MSSKRMSEISLLGLRVKFWKLDSQKLKQLTSMWIIMIICALSELPLNIAGNEISINTTTTNSSSNLNTIPGNTTLSLDLDKNLTSSVNETDELDWDDYNWRRKDSSKIASVAVYCSVILIALFGVLIKYFVTQYDNLQAKAQLEYQQLRNVNIQ